jgi:SnoaL-like domain
VPLSAEDVIAIQHLVARYNFAVDSGDGVDFAACFAPGGCFSYSGADPIEGASALEEFGRSLSRLGLIRHVVTSLLIEGGAGRATSKAYCQVFGVDGEGRSYVLSQGVYRDALVQVEGGAWRFEAREYDIDPVKPAAG